MRCLYCGKTLAFLKRLTGSGEFCSDAHRIKYQEEYNQLALSRLLHANDSPVSLGRTLVPADVSSGVEDAPRPDAKEPEVIAAELPPFTVELTPPIAEATLEPTFVEASAPEVFPAIAPEPVEAPPPPLARFLAPIIEISVPGAPEALSIEPATSRAGEVELPGRSLLQPESALSGEVDLASRVPWQPEIRERNIEVKPLVRAVELREFTGNAELPRLAVAPTPVHGVPETAPEFDQLEWSIAPRLASEAQSAWLASPAEFAPVSMEIGEWGKLEFAHSGYEELAEAAARVTEPAVPVPTEQVPLPEPAPAAAIRIVGDPSHIEPTRMQPARLDRIHFAPALTPARVEPQIPSPPPSRASRVTEMPPPAQQPSYRPALNFAVNYGPAVPASEPATYPQAAPEYATEYVEPAPSYTPPPSFTAPPPTYAPQPSHPQPAGMPPSQGQPRYVQGPPLPSAPVARGPAPYVAPQPQPTYSPQPSYPQQPNYPQPPFQDSPAKRTGGGGEYLPAVGPPQPLPASYPQQSTFPPPAAPREPMPPEQRSAPQVSWHGPALLSAPEPAQFGPAQHAPPQQVMVVPPPRPDTKPLPVTLHAMAAPAPQAALLRAEAMTSLGEPQVPRSSALPLRPLMYLGAAPAGAGVETKESKPEAVAAPTEMPRVKGKNGKNRRSDVRVIPSEPVEASKAPVPKPEIREEPKPEPKPELVVDQAQPEQTPEPKRALKPIPVPASEVDLRLPTLNLAPTESRWSKLPVAVKIGLAAAILLAITGAAYLVMNGGSASAGQQPLPAKETVYEAGLPLASMGWVENWTKARAGRAPRLDILPTSMQLSDYRIEFRSEILSKATGWVYRAQNPRNYYAAKLELIPGAPPQMVLARMAMIDGNAERLPDIKLTEGVSAGTVNTVKFEAIGGKFAVWVQDQPVAEWTDRRIGSGGVGIYADTGESAVLRGVFRVTPLVVKN